MIHYDSVPPLSGPVAHQQSRVFFNPGLTTTTLFHLCPVQSPTNRVEVFQPGTDHYNSVPPPLRLIVQKKHAPKKQIQKDESLFSYKGHKRTQFMLLD